MKKNITLIGMMGAGKSTTAEALAGCLDGYFAADTDVLVEYRNNLPIVEIFEKKGEEYFRNFETKILNMVYEKEGVVVALGGGAFEREENREIIKNNSRTVYLKASPETLFERLKNSYKLRPVLKDNFTKETVAKLLEAREKNYMQADFVVQTDGKTAKEVAQELVGVLNG